MLVEAVDELSLFAGSIRDSRTEFALFGVTVNLLSTRFIGDPAIEPDSQTRFLRCNLQTKKPLSCPLNRRQEMAMLDWPNASQAVIVIIAGARHFPVCSGNTQSCRRRRKQRTGIPIRHAENTRGRGPCRRPPKGHEVTAIERRDKSDGAGSCRCHP